MSLKPPKLIPQGGALTWRDLGTTRARWQVPLLHIGPCSPFSLTRAARNLESFPHGPSLKLYFMTEVIQFPITSSTPSLTQKERFPMTPEASLAMPTGV